MKPEEIRQSIAKGTFKPHLYLTNLCLAHFQAARGFVATKVFPTVPVALSSAHFYEFDKGDLARDNMQRKPELGRVGTAVYGKSDHFYHCEVDQIITGVDQIGALDYTRSNAPAVIDPRKAKARFIAEQMNIHLDRKWANKYFNPESWTNVYSGTDTTPGSNQFYYFDNANFDPVAYFSLLNTKMLLQGLRRPNKMVMGVLAYAALKNNNAILERVKYQGSEANPANVTPNLLAQLFAYDEVLVSEAVYNAAPVGSPNDMRFICDPRSVLLTYTTNSPSIEEPSAGYTFTWDMLGNGQYTAVQQFEGEGGTHAEFMEGLLCTDPEITAPDLGVFLKNATSPDYKIE